MYRRAGAMPIACLVEKPSAWNLLSLATILTAPETRGVDMNQADTVGMIAAEVAAACAVSPAQAAILPFPTRAALMSVSANWFAGR
jgi:hypothetical protein